MTIARTDAAWTRFPGQVRSSAQAVNSIRASGTLAPGLPSPDYAQISVASKCLSRFGALRLGKQTLTSEPIAGYLQAPGAVEGMRAGASSPSLPPQPRRLLPTPFRPAAVSEIARRPRIH